MELRDREVHFLLREVDSEDIDQPGIREVVGHLDRTCIPRAYNGVSENAHQIRKLVVEAAGIEFASVLGLSARNLGASSCGFRELRMSRRRGLHFFG